MKRLITTVGLLLVLALAPLGLELWLDSQFFASQGLQQVFQLRLQTQLLLGVGGGVVATAIGLLSLAIAARALGRAAGWYRSSEVKAARAAVIPLAVLLGLVFGIAASSQWNTWLTLTAQAPFGISVPNFGQDVAFYVWTLPALIAIHTWVVWLLVALVLTTALIYAAGFVLISAPLHTGSTFNYREEGVRDYTRHPLAAPAIRHAAVIGALLLGLAAISYWFANNQLVYSTRGVVVGASATDLEVVRPVNTLLLVLTAAMAVGLLVLAFRPTAALSVRYLVAFAAVPVTWVVLAFVLGALVPAAYEQFFVIPQQLGKERAYIEQNNSMTRLAWDLDRVQYVDLNGDASINPDTLARNVDALSDVRITDYRPLLDTFRQLQRIRQYYDFVNVTVDRYQLLGGIQQVMLAGREMDPSALPQVARTWPNTHLVYTHGYGATVSPVNQINSQGLPDLIVHDIPPVSNDPALQITRPQMYFGQKNGQYAIVGTRLDEFDYTGDSNTPEVKTHYTGGGTIAVGSGLQRLGLAAAIGDLNILISGDVTDTSSVLLHRDIQERVQHVAPFLQLDQDPYLVILDGHLVFIQDAYTATDKYPDAARFRGVNYLRNAVKITVDAYDGAMHFYVNQPDDPILQTYLRLYPTLFTPIDQAPAGLAAHFRYPEDLFNAQAALLTAYHMLDPQTFYNREDLWAIAQETYAGRLQQMGAYFTMLRLPGEAQEEFATILPFTPAGQDRNNMVAWMVARSDVGHYGELRISRFPQGKLIFGPQQIEARVNQEPTISSQITLWNQQGSQVIRGNLLVIPLDQSILYVQPLYIQAQQSPLPELKRVIVASTDAVVMSDQLDTALQALAQGRHGEVLAAAVPQAPAAAAAGAAPATPSSATAAGSGNLAQQARDHLRAAQQAAGKGDWVTFGQEMDQAQRLLDQLDGLVTLVRRRLAKRAPQQTHDRTPRVPFP